MSDDEQEPLDPRIQHELERLNKASLLINKLENDLDDARGKFRSLLTESTQQLENFTRRLGSFIEKAKPYYDCRLRAKELQEQTHHAAVRYEKAMSTQAAAREMVELAEQGYQTKTQKPSFDTAWQEMLNHATIKVMDAENDRMTSEGEHQRTAKLYAQVQEEVNLAYKENKRSISKSKVYYEVKAKFHTDLELQKSSIGKLQGDVDSAKKLYAKALENLEGISEEIHYNRQQRNDARNLGEREAGVGSESPVPPPHDRKTETKANNSKFDQDEIIISFPPSCENVVQDSTDLLTISQSANAINPNLPDKPLETAGIQINVIPSTACQIGGVSGDDNSLPLPVTEIDSVPVTNNNAMMALPNQYNGDSASSSTTASPVAMRHKRMLSGSIQLSAKRLLQETSSIDSDSGSVCSFIVLDDEGVASALNEEYFDGSYEVELRKSTHADYSKLPESLSCYQKPYESTRKSVSVYPPFEEAELKLEQVIKLLELSNDESIV